MGSPSRTSLSKRTNPESDPEMIDFVEQVRVNQKKLTTELKPSYDFIVCGSGSSGSEVAPGNLEAPALVKFIRDAAMSYAHQASTAKMGRDSMSVVDGQLKVYGVDNLRIADASILPRVTTGNTMAPCVVIGERAAEILKVAHRIN
jgi:choline dehydrogenase-like flavoprotein